MSKRRKEKQVNPRDRLKHDMERLIKAMYNGQVTEQNIYDLMFCGYRMYKSGGSENLPSDVVVDTIRQSLLRAVFKVGERC